MYESSCTNKKNNLHVEVKAFLQRNPVALSQLSYNTLYSYIIITKVLIK